MVKRLWLEFQDLKLKIKNDFLRISIHSTFVLIADDI